MRDGSSHYKHRLSIAQASERASAEAFALRGREGAKDDQHIDM